MPVPLHTVTIATYLQLLPVVAALLDKAEAHCRDRALPDAALTDLRLTENMWPFAKQIIECVHHSSGAILGARDGVFRPALDPAPNDFATLRREIVAARAFVESVDPGELEQLARRPLRFDYGSGEVPFVVEDFLLSFSLPNFYFHVTMVYALLRGQGLEVGKIDFLGRFRAAA